MGKEITRLKRVSEVLNEVLKRVSPVGDTEVVPVEISVNRVVARDVTAQVDNPPYSKSAVDGFAVRSVDTEGASVESPVRLKVVGKSRVGSMPEVEVGPGEAVEVSTGAPLPKGADAVVMLEFVRRVGEFIEVLRRVKRLENVDEAGSMVRKGSKLFEKGHVISPWDIPVLLECGVRYVHVFRKVKVGVLSVGTELFDVSDVSSQEELVSRIVSGAVPSSNRYMLSYMLEREGLFEVIDFGDVPDSSIKLFEKLKEALDACDAVIVTGGTGVSEYDITLETVEKIGPEYIVRGLALRPGRPTGVAVVHGKPIFMLSGYPLAALTGYVAVVRKVLHAIANAKRLSASLLRIPAVAAEDIPSSPGVLHYVRVRLSLEGDKCVAYPISIHGSSKTYTLAVADGLAEIPEDREGVHAGETVYVYVLREFTH